MSFKNLHLHDDILKAIEESGYTTPTPIQEQAIPKVLAGHDLLASAQTGSGKTGAFILPALHKLTTPSTLPGHGPRILILVPTRELAMQVAEQAVKYSNHLPRLKTACIYGGAPYPIQIRQLTRPLDILVATPGRLIDHMQSGRINFSRVEFFVLDEADRMLDMGFIDPVEEIQAALPKTVQTLFFSATLKGQVMKLATRLLKNPMSVSIEQVGGKHENITQFVHHVDDLHHKIRLLDHLLQNKEMNQAIIFTSTKRYCDELVDELLDRGHSAAALHGDLNQRKRTQRINSLKDGKTRILVATDVAARGLDVNTITHVFNFDLPRNPEDYVHRIGRTGRANAKGTAYSFVSRRDRDLVRNIERFTGQKIELLEVEGMKSKAQDRAMSRERAPQQDRADSDNKAPFARDSKPRFSQKREREGGYRGGREGGRDRGYGERSSPGPKFGSTFERRERPERAEGFDRPERSDRFDRAEKPAFGNRDFNRAPGGFKARSSEGRAPFAGRTSARSTPYGSRDSERGAGGDGERSRGPSRSNFKPGFKPKSGAGRPWGNKAPARKP